MLAWQDIPSGNMGSKRDTSPGVIGRATGLSAAIYTQTMDVELRANGLMIYDRKILKMPVDKLKQVIKNSVPIIQKFQLKK